MAIAGSLRLLSGSAEFCAISSLGKQYGEFRSPPVFRPMLNSPLSGLRIHCQRPRGYRAYSQSNRELSFSKLSSEVGRSHFLMMLRNPASTRGHSNVSTNIKLLHFLP